MKTFRRDKLRRLIEAGRVVMVGSYHYDDMTGGDRKENIAIKAAIMPADRSQAVYDGKTAYLYASDFTGYGRAWLNDDGTIHLFVHSNCNYDFRIVERTDDRRPRRMTDNEAIAVQEKDADTPE